MNAYDREHPRGVPMDPDIDMDPESWAQKPYGEILKEAMQVFPSTVSKLLRGYDEVRRSALETLLGTPNRNKRGSNCLSDPEEEDSGRAVSVRTNGNFSFLGLFKRQKAE